MEIVPCLDEDNLVVGATREEYVTGFPLKNESLGFEERVVVAMAAIVFGLRGEYILRQLCSYGQQSFQVSSHNLRESHFCSLPSVLQ